MLKKSQYIGLAIAIVVIATAISVAMIRHHRSSEWVNVRYGTMVDAVYGLGTVEANNVFNLNAGVTSVIDTIYVKTGDQVKKGQRLIKYVEGQLIRAPFSGTITYKSANAYQITNLQQTPLLTLVNLTDRYLLVTLDQDSMLRLKGEHPRVLINFSALPHQKFTGTVTAIYSNSNNFYLKITPQQLPSSILPGMTADIALILGETKPHTMVPIDAVENQMVTYKVSNKQMTIKVKLGQQADGWVQILSDNVPKDGQVRIQ